MSIEYCVQETATFQHSLTERQSYAQHSLTIAFPSTYSQTVLVLCDMSVCNSRNPNVLQHIMQ